MAAVSALATSEETSAPIYLILNPNKGRKRDIVKYFLLKDVKSGMSFLESSDEEIKSKTAIDQWWKVLLTLIITKILQLFDKPMEYLSYIVEFFLNLLSLNGGFFGILYNLFHGNLRKPKRGSKDFLSMIGHVDDRIELYKTRIVSEKVDNYIASDVAKIKSDLGDKYLMDLCIMASKIVYENKEVVQNVVDNYWEMHFVAFYDCWIESQKESNTQVFICCDKEVDANLIVISFRGTEPLTAQDWITDFDFSWYEIPKVGKVHIGFLEALGLGSRSDPATFQTHLAKHETDFFHLQGESMAKMKELAKKRAYYTVVLKLTELLEKHKNAKFVVTGHSLGGALAILFPSVLVIQEEREILDRLLNVYTFGQPRVGDTKFAGFMEAYINYPETRYFRVVYCNDMVPRVPFDDKVLFAFKHFGTCIHYDSWYFGELMEEAPNKNYLSLWYAIPMWINAYWEMFRSLILHYIHGPDYKETWCSTLFRIAGFFIPGLSAHSPVDYVNSVRLGRDKLFIPSLSLESFVLKS
ncbi:triacylglycerol lipase OBL1-like [Euphorbia lathyris]|uniref:triacylglycerol lipase OBL1-like n=1 Tax=Euphorbia lathyris TaxID=212925 RepID=UPI00331363A8